MKIAFIAHPIGGDVSGNLEKIKVIVRFINFSEENVVPFAPYYADALALDDDIKEQRERGLRNDRELFNRKFIDELRLYGDRISPGMIEEIYLAWAYKIPVVPCTEETKKIYERDFAYLKRDYDEGYRNYRKDT